MRCWVEEREWKTMGVGGEPAPLAAHRRSILVITPPTIAQMIALDQGLGAGEAAASLVSIITTTYNCSNVPWYPLKSVHLRVDRLGRWAHRAGRGVYVLPAARARTGPHARHHWPGVPRPGSREHARALPSRVAGGPYRALHPLCNRRSAGRLRSNCPSTKCHWANGAARVGGRFRSGQPPCHHSSRVFSGLLRGGSCRRLGLVDLRSSLGEGRAPARQIRGHFASRPQLRRLTRS